MSLSILPLDLLSFHDMILAVSILAMVSGMGIVLSRLGTAGSRGASSGCCGDHWWRVHGATQRSDMQSFRLLILAVSGLGLIQEANPGAATFTFRFAGHITRIDDSVGNMQYSGVQLNGDVSGWIRYDATAPDRESSDPEIGEYLYTRRPSEMSISFGKRVEVTQEQPLIVLQVRDRTCADTPDLSCSPAGTFEQGIIFVANDPDRTLTPLFGWYPQAFVWYLNNYSKRVLGSDQPPTSINFADWEQGGWWLTGSGTQIHGTIDSVHVR